MLSIKAIGSSVGEVNYYAELGQEDYYTSCEEPPGVWWGEGAKALGESGIVDKERFGSLCAGSRRRLRGRSCRMQVIHGVVAPLISRLPFRSQFQSHGALPNRGFEDESRRQSS